MTDCEPSDLPELTKKASLRLDDDPRFKALQFILIASLTALLALHRAVESGMLLFITTFCVEAVGIEESFGRYLISIYGLGVVCYRLSYGTLSKVFGFEVDTVWSVVVAFTVRLLLCGVVFVFFGDSKAALVAVFALCGFCGSPIFPGLFAWGELVRPFTGFMSCLFTIGMYVGETVFLAVMGTVAEVYGVRVLSIAVTVPLAAAVSLAVFNALLFRKYKMLRAEAIGR